MKNLKFSRLFAAIMFVAVLGLTGCKPEPEVTEASIYGTWVSSYNEKFVITEQTAAEKAFDMWAIDIKEYNKVSSSSGVFYGLLTKGSDYTPAGTYYAVAYKDLTDNSVKIAAAATSYSTLEEVKANCTIENMFNYSSTCTKE